MQPLSHAIPTMYPPIALPTKKIPNISESSRAESTSKTRPTTPRFLKPPWTNLAPPASGSTRSPTTPARALSRSTTSPAGREYLGLGPSAFSTLAGNRIQNICNTAEYVARIQSGATPQATCETLDKATLLKERIAFGLRKDTGVPEDLLEGWRTETLHLKEIGLLESRDGRALLTRRGRMLADAVGEAFM